MRALTGALIGIAATAVAAPAAGAATLIVTTTSDGLDGSCTASRCTLRDAVRRANATAAPDTIVLRVGTYRLTLAGAEEDAAATGDLDVLFPTTIVGKGSGRTTIDARRLDRALDVPAPAAQLELRGVRLTRGSVVDDGGCLRDVAGTGLTLVDVRLDHCTAGEGGGLAEVAEHGLLRADRLVIRASRAREAGGCALVRTWVEARLMRTTLTGCRARTGGGLLRWSSGLPTRLTQVDVRANRADDAGGIEIEGDGALIANHVRISANVAAGRGGGGRITGVGAGFVASEIVGNTAAEDGGLLIDTGPPDPQSYLVTAAFTDSTIARNTALVGDAGGVATTADTSLRNTTVYGNAAAGQGGGVLVGGTLDLRHATLAGNTAIFGAALVTRSDLDARNSIVDGSCLVFGSTASFGGNVASGTGCGLTSQSDQHADPLLGTYGAHGGDVATIPLLAGSPAIDRAQTETCRATDARGVSRPRDGDGDGVALCDAGAYER